MKLREHADEDENKLPELSRTKLGLVFVLVFEFKAWKSVKG